MSKISFPAAELLSNLSAAEPFRVVLKHGDVSAVIYAPKNIDEQTAHARAEIYIVIRGRGRLRVGHQEVAFAPGDLLYVDAGLEHRFVAFDSDLAVWAVFFGPSIVGNFGFDGGGCSFVGLNH